MHEPSSFLHDLFGLTALKDAQVEAISALESGRDVLVRLPTGYGKSLCYQLPAVRAHAQGRGLTLVVSPLVALMDDQVASLTCRGINAVALHGSLRGEARTDAQERLRNNPALVYASPERMKSAAFRRRLARLGVAYLAIDEAHCISEWGHDFRPSYKALGTLREELGVPCIALTATATQRVADTIRTSLGLDQPVQVHRSIARANLRWGARLCQGDHEREQEAIACLRRLGFPDAPGRAVVYVTTRKRAQAVAKAIRAAGIVADHYHAGRTVGARQNVIARYERGAAKVLVATTAFGMGMDRSDVRAVIHVEAPGSLEAYLQQAGRAGRDGRGAECLLLYSSKDPLTHKRLWGRSPGPGALEALDALHRYATGTTCREQTLGAWFGETLPDCGHCDACDAPEATADAAEQWLTQRRRVATARTAKSKADSAVRLTPEQEKTVLAFVDALTRPVGRRLCTLGLRGSRAKAAKKRGVPKNPHFGALKGLPEVAILATIDAMLADGRLVRKGKKYPTVWMPDKKVRTKSASPRPRRVSSKGPLYDALRNYRKNTARKRRWKAYQVFPNATLDAVVKARPTSLDELSELPGVGPSRLSKFGEDVLRIVRQH